MDNSSLWSRVATWELVAATPGSLVAGSRHILVVSCTSSLKLTHLTRLSGKLRGAMPRVVFFFT